MNRSLAILAIGLFFGGGIGFLIAASNGVTLVGHDHDAPADHTTDMTHSHDTMQAIPADGMAPTLDIAVIKDPMSGWNLHVLTDNFRFAPEHASLAHVDGEGHAHVYVNGTKIARLYGPWMHISSLPSGSPTIEVVLNSNNHHPLSVGEKPVSASVSVTVD